MANLPSLQQLLASGLVPAVAAITQARDRALLDALLAIAPQLPQLVDAGLCGRLAGIGWWAERPSMVLPARWRSQPAALWERLALWKQMTSVDGRAG
ncbi:hypothetical protein [Micromonospora sp. NPDC000668]|uniref:hypothetical protein n=1 Tax=Micromonospora sp. NPDC000668 TaxID=3364219 RepID=UPI003691538E